MTLTAGYLSSSLNKRQNVCITLAKKLFHFEIPEYQYQSSVLKREFEILEHHVILNFYESQSIRTDSKFQSC